MKKINNLLIIAILCGSAQASLEMKTRIGGGLLVGPNAQKQTPILELDVDEVKKKAQETLPEGDENTDLNLPEYLHKGGEETGRTYILRGSYINEDDSDNNSEASNPQEFSLNNQARNQHLTERHLKTLIASSLKDSIDSDSTIYINYNSAEAIERSFLQNLRSKDEKQTFVSPIGCVELDFAFNHNDSKIFYGLTMGLHHSLAEYVNYDISALNVYYNECLNLYAVQIQLESFVHHIKSINPEKFKFTNNSKKQEFAIDALPYMNMKQALKSIDEVWNVRIKAGTQYHIGPFLGFKITNNMNISLMPAFVMKHSSIHLKNGDEVTKLSGQVMFGIMPALKFEYNFNNKLGVYIQAGYAYFFDSKKKRYDKGNKAEISAIMHMLDLQGPKTSFNVSAGLSYKIM